MSYQNRIDDSTSEYRLTDFGYVFYKTLYATYAYEERKGVIPKGSSDHIKEALSSKTVQIMRYRPQNNTLIVLGKPDLRFSAGVDIITHRNGGYPQGRFSNGKAGG